MDNEQTFIQRFDELRAGIAGLVAPVKSLTVSDFPSSAAAIDVAKQIRDWENRLEKRRKELVDPHNRTVKQINEYAKTLLEPLKAAGAHVQTQLVAFEREQERIRAEERRRAEEELRRKREEMERQQEIERQALETKLAAQEAVANALGIVDDEEPVAEPTPEQVAEEMAIKHAQENALLRATAAQVDYDIKQRGIRNARKTWKCELVDISLVPKHFLTVTLNTQAVLAAARGGTTDIPGVRLWQDTTIAIGARTGVSRAMLEEES